MSDFDKIFADKLDKEGRFPQKEKNWQRLSRRLDAFEAGMHGSTRRLRVWQAAAAVSLIAASALFGKVISMRRENAELQQQVVRLQAPQPRQNENKNLYVLDKQVYTSDLAVEKQEEKHTSHDRASEGIFDKTAAEHLTAANNEKIAKGNEKRATGKPAASPAGNAGQQVVAHDQTAPPGNAGRPVPPAGTEESGPAPAQQSPDSSTVAIKETAGEMPPAPLLPLPLPGVKSNATPEKPVMPAVAAAQEPVRPVRYADSRLRLGAQAVATLPLPRGKGISMPAGPGISAEYTLLPHLRVAASADWLHYSVDTDTFVPHFNFPDLPPPPGNPHHELTGVYGSQRNQQYSLGLGYTVPLRFWVRPTLRIYHTWTRTTPATLVFEYEEHGPGGGGPGGGNHHPEYIVKKLDGKWLGNTWRLGVGLEHETPRFVFALSADYSRSSGADDSLFDAVILKGGIQYKFD